MFVLPKWLRRPARHIQRLTSGEVEPPRFAALVSSLVLIGSASLYGAVLGGHMPGVIQAVTARTGFAVETIDITGNTYTSEIDVFQAVGLNGWTSLIGLSAGGVQKRIGELPWVERVAVQKIYPSTLQVTLEEREPFGIWQQGGRLFVIERDGSVIAPLDRRQFRESLPVFVGAGAETLAAAFHEKMKAYPAIAARARAYVRVANRRWDIRLDNGMTIKLPEEGIDEAIAVVAEAERAHQLFARDVLSVDLRIADRMVLRLSEEAAKQRDAMLEERLGDDYEPEKRT